MISSLNQSMNSSLDNPYWLYNYLNISIPQDGSQFEMGGQLYALTKGIPRSQSVFSDSQTQTGKAFGFKWKKRETFESTKSLERMKAWLIERYGNVEFASWIHEYGDRPILIDAGCGAGMSALELFGSLIPKVRYLGVDISEAVDVAALRFSERGLKAQFLQADICNLPFPDKSVDLIFSEGVLHHTSSTKWALTSLAKLLKVGGRFLFYVYRKKGPLREFTDDFIRMSLQDKDPETAWKAMEPLTQLGITLGELDLEINIPKPIDLLGIAAGKINLQRFFYWHIAKAFYHPELTFEEMNHINYDWYAPINASRQTIEEVRSWCEECQLKIEHQVVEDSGITVIAKKVT